MPDKLNSKTAAEKVKRTLRYSIYDGSAYNVMAGFGDNYITPFALRLGAGSAAIGALASIPTLVGSVVQPLGARLSEITHSRKAVILPAIFGHAFMWLPILSIPFLPFAKGMEVPLLIAFVTLGVALGSVAGPAWISLMGDLVPERERGKYFGMRNEATGFVGLASLLTAGFLLNLFPSREIFTGFALLFAVAFAARTISMLFLAAHYEPTPPEKPKKATGIIPFFKEFFSGKQPVAKFSRFICSTRFAVALASPFFTVYMLRDLGFDYFTFAALCAVQAFSTYIAMPYWGRLSDEYGNRAVLRTAGFLVSLVPFLWLPSQRVSYLALVHVFTGFAWAGFDLAAFNYVLDSTTREQRAAYAANVNFASGVAVFAGALIGGFLATAFERTQVLWLVGLPALFFISGLTRSLSVLLIGRAVEEVRVKPSVPGRQFFWRAVVVYPAANVTHTLVWSWTHVTAVSYSAARVVAHRLPFGRTRELIRRLRKRRLR
jgi:MFS family permease